ncbi:hypothetical protein Tco_0785568 [Tanacetum coccineum]
MLFTMPSWKQVNPSYKFKWTEKTVSFEEGSSGTTTEGYMENYKNVSQDIRNQLDAKVEAVQIMISTSQLMLVQMHFGKFTSLDGESLESYYLRFYKIMNESSSEYPVLTSITTRMAKNEVNELRDERLAHTANPLALEKEIDKLMALISLSFKKIYKPTNNNLRTSSNTSRANQDNTLRINRGTGYDNQRVVNVAGARENRDDTDDELDDQELEAHYLYMAKIQEVTPDAADNSGPIFDTEPLQKEQGDTNITIDLLDMSTNRETIDHDDDDLAKDRDLLTSLIEKLKYEIDDSKNRNKLLESSNKTLIDKLKGEIKDLYFEDYYSEDQYAVSIKEDTALIPSAKNDKSSIDEPPEVKLKDLPPHLKYVFLEGDNKLPIIIAKDLSVEEKAALIKVLKSHKRAIAWKLSDIKDINPEFCTHKILMEEDYKMAVQHQRRVNPKIHDVIKKEVEKLLDTGLIYPISDSP